MPDPRVQKRAQQMTEELMAAERELSNISGRIAAARHEIKMLLEGPVVDAATGKIGWIDLESRIRKEPVVGLKVVTRSADVLAARWYDFLALADQALQLKDASEKRKYKGILENLSKPPARPQNPAPVGQIMYPRNAG